MNGANPLQKIWNAISKKLTVTAITGLALWINAQSAHPLDPETVRDIVSVIMAYLIGQAVVDTAKAVKTK